MGTASLMGSGAFIIGGRTFRFAEFVSPNFGIEAWRLTMIFVGIPGLVLAPLFMMTAKEPARGVSEDRATEQASIGAVARHIGLHYRYYLPFVLALGISAIGTYSLISWAASML